MFYNNIIINPLNDFAKYFEFAKFNAKKILMESIIWDKDEDYEYFLNNPEDNDITFNKYFLTKFTQLYPNSINQIIINEQPKSKNIDDLLNFTSSMIINNGEKTNILFHL